MSANSNNDAFNRYLKRFINEHIKTLPTRSFGLIEDYESMFMLMFKGWSLLKMHPCSSHVKLRKLEPLIEMIDRFDDGIERPIQLSTLRSIEHHPDWKRIQNEARQVDMDD